MTSSCTEPDQAQTFRHSTMGNPRLTLGGIDDDNESMLEAFRAETGDIGSEVSVCSQDWGGSG
jgi:hypothetical protein